MKFILVFLTFLVNFAVAAEPNEIVFVFHGASDASAGAAIGGDTFIVADDENNTLRVYKVGLAKPIFSFDLSEFLQTTAKNPEADIEGAAKTGNRIYLITSHGRNKDGEYRPNRYRFFAAEIVTDGNSVGIKPVGRPYENLAIDLVSTKSDVQRDLVKATGFGLKLKGKDLERLAPKSEGLISKAYVHLRMQIRFIWAFGILSIIRITKNMPSLCLCKMLHRSLRKGGNRPLANLYCGTSTAWV